MLPRSFRIALFFVFGGIVGLSAVFFSVPQPSTAPVPLPPPSYEKIRLSVGGVPVIADLADTAELRVLGLSGRAFLAEGSGMWFDFQKEGSYRFWMKDMRFQIDILWIADNGEIVHIKEKASPDTYPESFSSEKPARYVLEVPAGFAEKHAVSIGDKAVIHREP